MGLYITINLNTHDKNIMRKLIEQLTNRSVLDGTGRGI